MSTGREIMQAMHEDYEALCDEKGALAANAYYAGALTTAAVTAPYLAGGLETTVGWVGANVLAATNDVWVTGAANGVTSFTIEAGLTLLYGGFMKRFSHTATLFEEKKYAELEEGTRKGARLGRVSETVGLALAAGSPGIMLRSFVQTPHDNHIKKGMRTAGILGAVNCGFSVAAAEGLSLWPWALQWAEKGWPFAVLFMGPHAIKTAKDVFTRRFKTSTDDLD